jgi:hypothetical protein
MPNHAASPFRLNLEQQRKRAKDLHRALVHGDQAALQRFRIYHPDGRIALSEAQFVIARELGLPSWPKLKAHITSMQRARDAMGTAPPLDDTGTLHTRCGSDLQTPLRDAGFSGDFLEYSNPLCQGPVIDDPDWLRPRAAFIADAYGSFIGRDLPQITQGLDQAEHDLHSAAQRYDRVVLWFEHDSYDQLVLARCLAQFAETPPRRLDLISIDHFPGAARFIGLGQLPPEALHPLWTQRQPVTPRQCQAGASVWRRLRVPDPTRLAAMTSALPELPHLAIALRRHCQELPWLQDGLSLTERLVLQILADGPRTIGDIFGILMHEREPLPWLGDIMLVHILRCMQRARQPVFESTFAGDDRRWPHERLTITDLGRAILAGHVDWLSLRPPERWVGGVCIAPGLPCWYWNDQAGAPVLRPPTALRT